MFLGVIIGVAVALFVAAFLSKRRFGLLGLALTAGATISTIWDEYATTLVSLLGRFGDASTTEAVVLAGLVLLPAILLLFHGASYKAMFPRIMGALLFSALAVAFLVVPIGHAVPLEGTGLEVYNRIVEYKNLIISIGVICAVADAFFTKPVKASSTSKKH